MPTKLQYLNWNPCHSSFKKKKRKWLHSIQYVIENARFHNKWPLLCALPDESALVFDFVRRRRKKNIQISKVYLCTTNKCGHFLQRNLCSITCGAVRRCILTDIQVGRTSELSSGNWVTTKMCFLPTHRTFGVRAVVLWVLEPFASFSCLPIFLWHLFLTVSLTGVSYADIGLAVIHSHDVSFDCFVI